MAPVSATPNPALEEYIAGPCPLFEGDVDHFYLDTKGYVTVGTGCMVPDVASAVLLPMRGQGTGAPAGTATIVAEYMRVKRMPFGPKISAASFRSAESLVLQTADRLVLRRQRASSCLADLRRLFPGFDSFPQAEQLALLDMDFNLGPNRLQHEYVHLCAAVRARDPRAAAAQCARNASDPAFAARNAWTRNRFLASSITGDHQ